jgi:WD40 repeat protein
MEQVVAELDTAVRAAGLTPRLLTSPGGDRRVVIPSQGGAYLQDTSTNRVIVEFQGPAAHRGPVLNAAFSSTGKHLATVSDDQAARLWDPATGRSLGELRGHTAGVVLARFSSDDQFLLTASDDGTARVWDVEVAAPVAILRGLAGEIRDAAFGPDGRLVATVSADNIVSMFSCHECVAAQDLLTLARTRAHRALTTEEYGRFIQELAEQ